MSWFLEKKAEFWWIRVRWWLEARVVKVMSRNAMHKPSQLSSLTTRFLYMNVRFPLGDILKFPHPPLHSNNKSFVKITLNGGKSVMPQSYKNKISNRCASVDSFTSEINVLLMEKMKWLLHAKAKKGFYPVLSKFAF
jgi:hypothetical protein